MIRRTQSMRRLPWPALGLAVGAGLVVLFAGLWEVAHIDVLVESTDNDRALFVMLLAVAVGAYRLLPSLALLMLWGLAAVQLLYDIPILLVELAMALVAYGCARYGRVATVVAGALSAPAIAVIARLTVHSSSTLVFAHRQLTESFGTRAPSDLFGTLLLIGVAFLLVPWLTGLLLRVLRREAGLRAEQLETARERDQAAELAEVREGQARLARDVHDVVGHSLAVILAQAESAQYLPDDDTERVKQTLATIAASARSSLQDVRHVLGATDGAPVSSDLDELVDGVRTSGHEVVSTVLGDPQPLPPDLATVAYRVLQEMLTNAIRHGRRDEPVRVQRDWQHELRIEVSNVIGTVGEQMPAPPSPGNGLEGMLRRLESVGGRLDVRPDDGPDGRTFTATAWLPTGAR